MRKVLILAALLMLSTGTSYADHCQDTIDWAGFTVPCHPTDMGALIFKDHLRRQEEELKRHEKLVRAYRYREYLRRLARRSAGWHRKPQGKPVEGCEPAEYADQSAPSPATGHR